MSSNPFAKFSAGAGGGGSGSGWLTTKKRGKDDAQIERDRNKALDARKAARRRTTKGKKTVKKTTKKATSKQKRSRDEYDDLDGFIVGDDEEEDSFIESSEGEEVVPVRRKSAKTRPGRQKKITYDELSSDDDSVEVVESVPKKKSTNDKPARSDDVTSSDDDSNVAKTAKMNKSKKVAPTFDTFSSDDDDRVANKAAAEPRKKSAVLESDSDDDSDSFLDTFQARKSRPAPAMRKTIFSDSSNRSFQDEKKDDSSAESSPLTSRYFKKPSARASIKPKSTDVLQDSSSEEDEFPAATARTNTRDLTEFDGCEDDDEALAVAMALSESQEEQSNVKQRKRLKKSAGSRRKKKKKISSPEVVELMDSEDSPEKEFVEESDEDEDSEDEQDAYEDQKASEAGSVLKAANDLGAKVLHAMGEWCKKGGEDAPTGIIVDGTLALHESVQNASNHSWISQELMQEICPQLKLADYQLIGLNWLALLHGLTCDVVDGKKQGKKTNVNGVLADEMGLGKTVQTIAFLAWLRYQNRGTTGQKDGEVVSLVDDESPEKPDGHTESRPHLIVVPSSVLSNWEREFKKFCPSMNVIRYHGSLVEKEGVREEMRNYLPGASRLARAPLDVVLTTYSMFSKEKSDDRNFLRRFQFDYMVVDEAHSLKNPRGKRYMNLDKLETSHRLLLTGTPVQNSPKELMSLLCFLMPLFSRKSTGGFFDEESKNDGGESMLQHFVSLESAAVGGDDANVVAYRKLKQLFAPFVLRRRKVDVLSQIMPPKTRKVEKVPFDNATRTIYDSILAAHIGKGGNPSVPMGASAQQHIFTLLRKAANHPLLLRRRHTSEEAISHLAKSLYRFGYFGRHETITEKHVREELTNFSDFDIHCAAHELIEENELRRDEIGRYTLSECDLFASPKFTRLRDLLPGLVAEGHRILIFSQWTRSLDLLGCLMESLGMKFLRLDGTTAVSARQQLIDTFQENEDIPVFLLSTRAGGMGINLTAADTCILHDLDFNPFNDIQAEDRCHRVGQKKPVTVIKMVTKATVDEAIYDMQEKKAKMNAAILESGRERGDATTQDKKEEENEISNIMKSVVDRFLQSPTGGSSNTELDVTMEEESVL